MSKTLREDNHLLYVQLELEVIGDMAVSDRKATALRVRESLDNSPLLRTNQSRLGIVRAVSVSRGAWKKSYARPSTWNKACLIIAMGLVIALLTYAFTEMSDMLKLIVGFVVLIGAAYLIIVDAWRSWVSISTIAVVVAALSIALSLADLIMG